MDDPSDLGNEPPIHECKYVVGDLVRFISYYYSPDFYYPAHEDLTYGIVVQVLDKSVYYPVYRVFWFKANVITTVIESQLRKYSE